MREQLLALAVGPDLGPRVLAARERSVVRHSPVRIDPHDGAEVIGEILGRIELEALG